jgi:hypothetical protein
MCDYTGIGNRVVGDCAGPSGKKISAESHSAWSKIPCVPTFKATRVTSKANAESWSIIELTVPTCNILILSIFGLESGYMRLPFSVDISPSTWISIF